MRWTDQQVAILRRYWHTPQLAAQHLRGTRPYRTLGAIRAKARALGLKGGADKEVAVDVPEHG
jgi:hypothetical protein